MSTTTIQMPEKVEIDNETLSPIFGRFILQPLEKGYGATVGNSLRRVLISSLPGFAITSIRIEDILHEFTTIPGVVEDISEIIMNLKQVRMRLVEKKFTQVDLSLKGKREFKAGYIQEMAPDVEILNPDFHLATLSKENARLEITLTIARGKGYSPAEENKIPNSPVGTIAIDAIFTPITNVRTIVEATRVGQQTDFEKLILEVETDGSITPEVAVSTAAKILKDNIQLFIAIGPDAESDKVTVEELNESQRIKKILLTPMDELELSVRSRNCLQAANIKTISELVVKEEKDLLNVRNFGRKSLAELSVIIENFGLHFGYDVHKYLDKE
jgi:DNA-directed RNA polymerase subunit alpha